MSTTLFEPTGSMEASRDDHSDSHSQRREHDGHRRLRHAASEDAPPAGTTFTAQVHRRAGSATRSSRDLPPTYADEPEVLGGTNTAANPVEQILGALGSCLAIGYTAGAVARGIKIEDLRIDLAGNIDLPVFFGLKAGHAGYEHIDAKVFLRSNAPKEALKALHDDVFRTSPVGNTLERPAALSVELVGV